MRKLASVFAVAALIAAFGSGLTFAQSSGNFSASAIPASCAIGTDGKFSGGTGITVLDTNISTSNGSGVTLNIRPSFVTGLFTDTKISTAIPSATADVGIKVCVTVDGSSDGILPTGCVVYDERFQQISSQLFSQLAACALVTSATACTVNSDCAALGSNYICNNPLGLPGGGLCVVPNPLCNFELLLSTLSAHSFDFVVPVSKGKPHDVKVTWSTKGTPTSSSSEVASCVGPGIVTVTQYKVFNNSGALLTF